ncbi:MAG: glycosyltransferase family 4 protein [Dehalococcoidales bacterium]|jgi:glycosyltransferase involved in cell wall biosynthesis|nr:glycosyltransferase family 4 protein [Dehalococcoidales bacterium]
MKIVQVHSAFFPAIGGVENYAFSLCRELIHNKHEVTVVTSTLGTNKSARIEEHDNIIIKRVSFLFKIGHTPVIPNLYSELKHIEADVIHTHLPTPYTSDIAANVSRHRNIPCILTYHNDIVGKKINKYIAKTYNTIALNRLLDSVDKIIITQAEYIQRSPYLKKFHKKVVIIPCGVDTNRFKPLLIEKQRNTIFFFSILNKAHQYKGLDNLLEALIIVKQEIPDVRLVIGGAGDKMRYYRHRAKALGLEKVIDFCGFIPDIKLTEYYNKAGVFVLPSTSASQEGFGMVLLESLACKTPVITTDIVGISKDTVDNNAGIVVEPNDNSALAEAIIKILSDNQLAAEMGDRGRELIANKYGWDKIGARILKLYGEIK